MWIAEKFFKFNKDKLINEENMFNNNKECKGIALFIIFYLFKHYIKNLLNRNRVR
jgi:hypothetical protein